MSVRPKTKTRGKLVALPKWPHLPSGVIEAMSKPRGSACFAPDYHRFGCTCRSDGMSTPVAQESSMVAPGGTQECAMDVAENVQQDVSSLHDPAPKPGMHELVDMTVPRDLSKDAVAIFKHHGLARPTLRVTRPFCKTCIEEGRPSRVTEQDVVRATVAFRRDRGGAVMSIASEKADQAAQLRRFLRSLRRAGAVHVVKFGDGTYLTTSMRYEDRTPDQGLAQPWASWSCAKMIAGGTPFEGNGARAVKLVKRKVVDVRLTGPVPGPRFDGHTPVACAVLDPERGRYTLIRDVHGVVDVHPGVELVTAGYRIDGTMDYAALARIDPTTRQS